MCFEGVGDFPYTYEKTGDSTSVIKFDVEGEDCYDMTWTSPTGGNLQESFEGLPGNSGTSHDCRERSDRPDGTAGEPIHPHADRDARASPLCRRL